MEPRVRAKVRPNYSLNSLESRDIHKCSYDQILLVNKMCACIETKCCDVPHVIESRGAYVCLNCGLVVSDLCLEQRETFMKDGEGHYVRISERIGIEDVFPRSTLSPHNKDYTGHQISSSKEQLFQRLRVIEKQVFSNQFRNLNTANQIRHRIMSNLGFTDPKKISWRICQWVARTGFSQGRVLEATTIAAIYVAAIEQNFPITYEQLSEITHVRTSHLRHIVATYLSGRPASKYPFYAFPVKFTLAKFFSPNRHIRKLCNDLHYSPQTATLAEKLAQDIEQRLPTGHRPETKAAVFVNVTCGGKVSWNHLARVTGVQVPSLKEYWNRVEPLVYEMLHTNSSHIQEIQLNVC